MQVLNHEMQSYFRCLVVVLTYVLISSQTEPMLKCVVPLNAMPNIRIKPATVFRNTLATAPTHLYCDPVIAQCNLKGSCAQNRTLAHPQSVFGG